MRLPSKVKFADGNLRQAFEELGPESKIYAWLVRAFKDIEDDAFCGIQIPKRLIPNEYVKKYNAHNLWKYNLPDAWRLIYSIENQEILVVSIVLDWMDHKAYEKKFNY
jgi:mRNA-degrading endonuclease RelE of RelBE toxin-antitoxin system